LLWEVNRASAAAAPVAFGDFQQYRRRIASEV